MEEGSPNPFGLSDCWVKKNDSGGVAVKIKGWFKMGVVALAVLLGITVSGAPYAQYVMDNKVDGAFESAQILEKGVIVFFTLPRCSDCERMKREVFSQEETSNRIRNNFVLVEAGYDSSLSVVYPPRFVSPARAKQMTYVDLFREFGIRLVPSYAFFNFRFQHVHTHTGYLSPEEFMKMMEYALSPEAARGMSYELYTSIEGKPELRSILNEITTLQEQTLRAHNRALPVFTKEQVMSRVYTHADPFADYFFKGFESIEELALFLEEKEATLHHVYLIR